ncbi:MAG: hypothetical protein MUC48_15605 [Leptolyngbya sp. Prado105]|jgi:hypothetical protein|nr:hypothetical protein [Leptolyngbya sp. Prado105]
MKHRHWWIAWSVVSPISLMLSMAVSIIPGMILLAIFGVEVAPESFVTRTIQESLAGLFIGLLVGLGLGYAQERLLRNYFPRLRSWTVATLIPWVIEFTIAPWLNAIRSNQSLYATIAQGLDGNPFARSLPILIIGVWSAGMQALLLRRYLPHAERWWLMGIGWYAVALLFSRIDFTVGMLWSFAISNSISGWFLTKKMRQAVKPASLN